MVKGNHKPGLVQKLEECERSTYGVRVETGLGAVSPSQVSLWSSL